MAESKTRMKHAISYGAYAQSYMAYARKTCMKYVILLEPTRMQHVILYGAHTHAISYGAHETCACIEWSYCLPEALTAYNSLGNTVRVRNDYADHKGSKDTVREKVFGIKCINFLSLPKYASNQNSQLIVLCVLSTTWNLHFKLWMYTWFAENQMPHKSLSFQYNNVLT